MEELINLGTRYGWGILLFVYILMNIEKFAKIFNPSALVADFKEVLAKKQEKDYELKRDQQESEQLMQEAPIEALVQHNVTSTSQVISINTILVKDIIDTKNQRFDGLQKRADMLHQVTLRNESQLANNSLMWASVNERLDDLRFELNEVRLHLGLTKTKRSKINLED